MKPLVLEATVMPSQYFSDTQGDQTRPARFVVHKVTMHTPSLVSVSRFIHTRWRSAFDVPRSAFDVRRSTFDVRRSAFERSTFDVRRSTFDVRRSTFDVRRSAFDGRSGAVGEPSRFAPS